MWVTPPVRRRPYFLDVLHPLWLLQSFSLLLQRFPGFWSYVFMRFLYTQRDLSACISLELLGAFFFCLFSLSYFGLFVFILSNSVFVYVLDASFYLNEKKKRCGFWWVGKWEDLGEAGGRETIIIYWI